MRAVGVPMEGRGGRADRYLRVMQELWTADAPTFHEGDLELRGVDAHPRPLQRPLPVVVGGHSRAAHRRALQCADGWYGFRLDRRAAAEQIDSLRHEARTVGRDFEELTITVSPTEPLAPEVVRDYSKLGVDRLVVVPDRRLWRNELSVAEFEDIVRANAPELVGAEPSFARLAPEVSK
jgi:alkanesulfonate monooxygenase SsuD/methylene tetrahydromethanopterin reductase-like flavin-dependent oxidoreductase (luciferase family)